MPLWAIGLGVVATPVAGWLLWGIVRSYEDNLEEWNAYRRDEMDAANACLQLPKRSGKGRGSLR